MKVRDMRGNVVEGDNLIVETGKGKFMLSCYPDPRVVAINVGNGYPVIIPGDASTLKLRLHVFCPDCAIALNDDDGVAFNEHGDRVCPEGKGHNSEK